MKYLIAFFMVCLAAFNIVQAQQVRAVGNFSSIDCSSGVTVLLTQGAENKVTVSCSNDDFLNKIKTEVDKNGVLKIFVEYDKAMDNKKYKGITYKAFVTFVALQNISASSGSTINTDGNVQAELLNITVSSGAVLNASLQINNGTIVLSSGAVATIKGKANEISIETNSGAVVNGYEFATQVCNAAAASGAIIKIAVDKQLNTKVSSGGSIIYKGMPQIKSIQQKSGGGVKAFK